MAEWKRICRNRRLCVGLLLIFLLNGFLFVREQVEMDYGLDYTLPQTSISISTIGGSYEIAQENVDSHAALTGYLEWLEKYKKLPLADAIPKLESEKERLMDTAFTASCQYRVALICSSISISLPISVCLTYTRTT